MNFDGTPLLIIENPIVTTKSPVSASATPLTVSNWVGINQCSQLGVSIEVPAGVTVTNCKFYAKANKDAPVESEVTGLALTPGAGAVRAEAAVDVVAVGVVQARLTGVSGSPSNTGETVKVFLHREIYRANS